MKGIIAFIICAAFLIDSSIGQNLDDLDSYTVEEFYKKVDLDNGTLDEDGNDIDYIFELTQLEPGTYRIEITDGPGDLYEVKGTDVFIEFRGYFGYAGYGTECLIEVESGYYNSATVYKLE